MLTCVQRAGAAHRGKAVAVGVVLGICLQAANAFAQETGAPATPPPGAEPAERPFRGLYQPRPRAAKDGQSLVFGASAYGAQDENIARAISGDSSAGPGVSGFYSGYSSSLAYGRQMSGTTLGLSAGTSGTFSSRAGERLHSGFGAGADLATSFDKWNLGIQANVSDSPYFQLAVSLPVDVEAIAGERPSRQADEALATRHVVQGGGGISLSREIGRRSSFSLSYGITAANVIAADGGDDRKLLNQTGSVGFSRGLRRGLSLNLGYGYHHGSRTGPSETRPINQHDINVGLGLDKALSLTRRTRLSFSTGSSLVANQTLLPPPGSPSSVGYHFFLTGNAQLQHELGRTWGATAGYHRGVSYAAGIFEPLMGHTVSTAIGGYLQRWLHLGVGAYYSTGSAGRPADSNGFTSVTGNAQLTVTASRLLSFFGSYSYYRTRFDANVVLPEGVARFADRWGVRAGVNFSIPLLKASEGAKR